MIDLYIQLYDLYDEEGVIKYLKPYKPIYQRILCINVVREKQIKFIASCTYVAYQSHAK